MAEQRWSDDPAFAEVATPYAALELLRSRLNMHGDHFEVTWQSQPDEHGAAVVNAYDARHNESTLIRIHCPESYERLVRLARNVASTTGRFRSGSQEIG